MPRAQTDATNWNGLETLEPRLLLSGNGIIDVDQGLPDLSIDIRDSVVLPANYLSGRGVPIVMPMDVLNVDTAGPDQVALPVVAGTTVTIKLYARPENGATDGSDDILVGTVSDVRIGGLAVGDSKPVRTRAQLPSDLTDGNWRIVAVVDPGNQIAELNEDPAAVLPQANNLDQTNLFAVTQGLTDLIAMVTSSRSIPNAVTSANGKTYRLKFRLMNQGSLAVGEDTTTSASVVLRSVNSADEEQVDIVDGIDVGRLKPGRRTKTYRATVRFPNNVINTDAFGFATPVDTQRFVVQADNNNTVAELDETNNEGDSKDITVTLGAPSLAYSVSNRVRVPRKPILSGTGRTFKVPLNVRNVGNIVFDFFRFSRYNLTLVARPVGVTDINDGSQDVELSTESILTVQRLGVGRTTAYRLQGELPEQMPAGEYKFVVKVRYQSVRDQEEIEYYENTDKTFTVQNGFKNLAPSFSDTMQLPAQLLSGDGSTWRIPVWVTNTGTLRLDPQTTADLELAARPAADPANGANDVLITTYDGLNLSRLGPGKSRKMTMRVQVPAGLAPPDNLQVLSNDFVLVAKVTNSGAVNESDTDDNEAVSDPVPVTEGNPDLTVAIDGTYAGPGTITTGDSRVHKVPVVVTNGGNIATVKDQSVAFRVFARPTTPGADVLLTDLEDVKIGRLKPGESTNVMLPVNVPSNLQDGQYDFVVEIDPDNDVQELADDNNTSAPAGTFTAVQGLPDLAVVIPPSNLAGGQFVSGDGTMRTLSIVVRNDGNLRTVKDQAITVRISAINQTNSGESDVQSITGVGVGNLAPGASRPVTLRFKLPRALATADYDLKVELDSDNTLVEHGDAGNANGPNNSAIGPAVSITQGGPDITVAFGDDLDLPASEVAGSGAGLTIPVVVSNDGNLAVEGNIAVNLTIAAHRQADAQDRSNDTELLVVDDIKIDGLRPGKSKRLNLVVRLPASLDPGTIVLTVTIDGADESTELAEGNNEAFTGPLDVV